MAPRALRRRGASAATGVSFKHHYPMAAACAPSRASLLTGQYPSLHGVTQTDGLAKAADSDDMFWLAPDTVPTLGDWFRAGGYRTFFKGKWHASHAHLDAEDGDGYLLSIDDEGTHDAGEHHEVPGRRPPRRLRVLGVGRARAARPRQAQHGDGEGPVHGRRDDCAARAVRRRRERGAVADGLLVPESARRRSSSGWSRLQQGLRYHPSRYRHRQAPTHDEDLSTKPRASRAMSTTGADRRAAAVDRDAPKFYYQLQPPSTSRSRGCSTRCARADAHENTIVVFSSDHGDMQGAHGGCTRSGTTPTRSHIHVPFVVASPLLPGSAREVDIPTNHADLHPDAAGFAGIDQAEALAKLPGDHTDAHSLVGRDLSARSAQRAPSSPLSRSCS